MSVSARDMSMRGGAPVDASAIKDVSANVTNFRVLERGLVLHTLCDPSRRDPVADKNLIESIEDFNPSEDVMKSDYMTAPRNSIICRLISDGRGKSEEAKSIICYPFFSSHVSMPVKAGEQVWIIYERPAAPSQKRGYWISRIAEALFVEDANFTHGDRRNQFSTYEKREKFVDDGSGNFADKRVLTFQNGDGTPVNTTLPADVKSFVPIITGSRESSASFLEPVPRITKRPGDLVLQGSNNSSIVLGTVSGWGVKKRPNENTTKSAASTEFLGPGSIDIVAGRGRSVESRDAASNAKKDASPSNSTRPLVAKNELGFETDKNVAAIQDGSKLKKKGNSLTNPQEGDSDFLLDASRVLVASEIEVDNVFGTGAEGVAKPFEKKGDGIISQKGAAVAVKSDHVRIIARKTNTQKTSQGEPEDIKNSQINGTIRIVKEGNPNEDLASIIIEADGTIQISGSKIFLGRTKDEGGAGDGKQGDAPGNSQPFVKYQQLEDLLNATFQNIIDFATALQTNFAPPINNTPGFGGPNSGLTKTIKDCAKLITEINTRKSEVQKLKSKRIFGE